MFFWVIPMAAQLQLTQAKAQSGDNCRGARLVVDSTNANHRYRQWSIPPNVTSRIAEYECIVFSTGDRVIVEAGGVVAVKGSDFRDFVNPKGKNSHRFYSGMIWVPGVTMGLESIRSVLGHLEVRSDSLSRGPALQPSRVEYLLDTLVVPELDPRDAPHMLRLGYFDNDYADNSVPLNVPDTVPTRASGDCSKVRSRSTAANGQMPAWICLSIISGTPAKPQLAISPAAATRWGVSGPDTSFSAVRTLSTAWIFDVLVDSLDKNGFARHPNWAWSIALTKQFPIRDVDPRPSLEACEKFRYQLQPRWYRVITVGMETPPRGCMTQFDRLSVDESGKFWTLACSTTGSDTDFHGHVNWMPATYSGLLKYQNESVDGDIDVDLITTDYAGQTTTNANANIGLHIEFSSLETLYHFSTPWWYEFRKGATGKRKEMMGGEVGLEATVTGLLGLDSVHGAHGELHPAWALAMHSQNNARDDRWQVFARNWGNEGSCSRDPHYIDTAHNRIRVEIPWRDSTDVVGFDSVAVVSADFRKKRGDGATGPKVIVEPGKRVVLEFDLERPEKQSMVHGEIRLRWYATSGMRASALRIASARRLLRNSEARATDLVVARDRQQESADPLSIVFSLFRKITRIAKPQLHKEPAIEKLAVEYRP